MDDLQDRTTELKRIIRVLKKERVNLKDQYRILVPEWKEKDFWPSEANVETWGKYGERWPDPDELERSGYIVQRNWKRLKKLDWIRFYEWLIEEKDLEVESMEIELDERLHQKDSDYQLGRPEIMKINDTEAMAITMAREVAEGVGDYSEMDLHERLKLLKEWKFRWSARNEFLNFKGKALRVANDSIEYLQDKIEEQETPGRKDKRVKHGEKSIIEDYWVENQDQLKRENTFKKGGLNIEAIAREIKKALKLNSSTTLIREVIGYK